MINPFFLVYNKDSYEWFVMKATLGIVPVDEYTFILRTFDGSKARKFYKLYSRLFGYAKSEDTAIVQHPTGEYKWYSDVYHGRLNPTNIKITISEMAEDYANS